MADAMAGVAGVSAHHEINPLNETFHRYCRWYGLPVDDEGFLRCKAGEIDRAGPAELFFEASAHLSLSIASLAARFDARFILMVRAPDRVVNSYLRKGWYLEEPVLGDPSLAPGYQPTPQFHHSLGRLMPRGEGFAPWAALSRVGKLAWFWRVLNQAVLDQFAALPAERWRVQKLETLDYAAFGDLCDFMGTRARLTAERFAELSASKPNHFTGVPDRSQWSAQENAEFIRELGDLPARFGYFPGQDD